MLKLSASVAIILCASFLSARPSGHQVVHGQADVQALQNLMKITVSDKAIINWNEFSSSAGEMIQFIQPSSTSAVLNRVTGGNTSLLYGDLQANGQVYIVNPNGIVTGLHARIDAGALVASTLDVLDQDFIDGSALRFFGNSKAGVINLGTIKTSSGDAILFGYQVENDGTIDAAGKASLVASNKVVLKLDNFQRVFIASDAALFPGDTIDDPCLLAFNQAIAKDALHFKKDETGVFLSIDAPVATEAGSIRGHSVSILGDYVQVLEGAVIDVSRADGGGEILIGGDFQGKNETLLNAKRTRIAKDTRLSADALERGDGGKIILWSDELTGFYGRISARGGPNGGDGGFVEVSGQSLDFQGLADRQSPLGKPGMLLLDPINITISGGVDSPNVTNPGGAGTYLFTNCGTNPATINNGLLNANLGLGSVTINTSAPVANTCAGAGFNGDIIVAAPVTWAAATTLALIADRDITFNNNTDITSTGAGGDISLTAGRDVIMNGRVQNIALAPGANISVIANRNIDMIASAGTTVISIGTDFGTVLARATLGNINMQGGTLAGNLFTSIGSTSSANVVRGAALTPNTVTVEAGGTITLTAGNSPNSGALISQSSSVGNILTTASTNVNVTASGNITITTPFSRVAGIGLMFAEPGFVTVAGDTRINTLGNVTVQSANAFSAIGVLSPGAVTSIQSRLFLNVGGNLVMQTAQAGNSTGANIGCNQDQSTAGVLRTSTYIFVAGNIWMDGRLIAVCRLNAGYKGATVAAYPPESFIHCLGNIILIGGPVLTGNESTINYATHVNPLNTDFTAHVWAGGAPQNIFDPNGGIRCVNGADSSKRANVLGQGGPTPNTSARSTGDIIVGNASNFSFFGTGNSAPFSPFKPQVNGLFIEADACFTTGELWPAQTATIAGNNIFAGTLLGSNSPAFACDGLGGFAYDDNKYNTNLIPTPFTGVQTSVVPALFTPAVVSSYSTVSNVIIRSADKFLGELFRPTVGPVGVPNPSFSANAPASIILGDNISFNNIAIQGLPINVEISGSGPIPAIGPSPVPPAHLCSCSNSFDTITINSSSGIVTGIAPATGHIYLSANNNITQISGAGSDLSTSGLPAIGFITLISDVNNSGAGSITLADNITTAGGPIMLSAGIGAGAGTSGITQTAGQVSSGIGTITAQAVGNILIASTIDPAFISTTGNQTILSTTGNVTISQDVVTTTGSIMVTATAGDISITPPAGALSGAVTSTSGPISLLAGGNISVNGEPLSVTTTISPISIIAGNSVLIDQTVSDTSGNVTVTANSGNISINTLGIVSTTTGGMTLTAGNDIDLNGLATTLLSTSGPIFSTAGNNTNVTQNVATSGPITMISGVNMSLLAATTNISSSASPVILVVDNDFPSPPGIGPGLFSMFAGSQVNSGPGQPLQVFTAQQNLNILIPGFLNGFTFVPGTIFIDTDTEHWCVYYPDPFFGGPGYTIFYKNCLSVIAPVANEVVSEMLFSFNPANEWTDEIYRLPQLWRFMLIYPPGVNALTDYASEPYWISRKKMHLFHDPNVFKEDKPLAELVSEK